MGKRVTKFVIEICIENTKMQTTDEKKEASTWWASIGEKKVYKKMQTTL